MSEAWPRDWKLDEIDLLHSQLTAEKKRADIAEASLAIEKRKANGWENDARVAHANWNAACNDIAELKKALKIIAGDKS